MEPAETSSGGNILSCLQTEGVTIRTLGVSLVAIAAVAASLTLARQRGDQRRPELSTTPDSPPVPLTTDAGLDAIRSAGL